MIKMEEIKSTENTLIIRGEIELTEIRYLKERLAIDGFRVKKTAFLNTWPCKEILNSCDYFCKRLQVVSWAHGIAAWATGDWKTSDNIHITQLNYLSKPQHLTHLCAVGERFSASWVTLPNSSRACLRGAASYKGNPAIIYRFFQDKYSLLFLSGTGYLVTVLFLILSISLTIFELYFFLNFNDSSITPFFK